MKNLITLQSKGKRLIAWVSMIAFIIALFAVEQWVFVLTNNSRMDESIKFFDITSASVSAALSILLVSLIIFFQLTKKYMLTGRKNKILITRKYLFLIGTVALCALMIAYAVLLLTLYDKFSDTSDYFHGGWIRGNFQIFAIIIFLGALVQLLFSSMYFRYESLSLEEDYESSAHLFANGPTVEQKLKGLQRLTKLLSGLLKLDAIEKDNVDKILEDYALSVGAEPESTPKNKVIKFINKVVKSPIFVIFCLVAFIGLMGGISVLMFEIFTRNDNDFLTKGIFPSIVVAFIVWSGSMFKRLLWVLLIKSDKKFIFANASFDISFRLMGKYGLFVPYVFRGISSLKQYSERSAEYFTELNLAQFKASKKYLELDIVNSKNESIGVVLYPTTPSKRNNVFFGLKNKETNPIIYNEEVFMNAQNSEESFKDRWKTFMAKDFMKEFNIPEITINHNGMISSVVMKNKRKNNKINITTLTSLLTFLALHVEVHNE